MHAGSRTGISLVAWPFSSANMYTSYYISIHQVTVLKIWVCCIAVTLPINEVTPLRRDSLISTGMNAGFEVAALIMLGTDSGNLSVTG